MFFQHAIPTILPRQLLHQTPSLQHPIWILPWAAAKGIATKKSIDLPTSVTDDQVKGINELSKKSGKDFDKAYVDMMIQDHKDDIKEFAEANKKVADNDLKNFISGTLPILQKHLDSIQAIKSKM